MNIAGQIANRSSLALDPLQVDGRTLVGISTSLKPGAGGEGRSAARGLLYRALLAVNTVSPGVMLLDIRDHPLPLFDGRLPQQRHDPELAMVGECVRRSGALLFALGAYWSGVSGVFKNAVDVLCGPAYDLRHPLQTVFTDKPVGMLVVGADAVSAQRGAEQAESILRSVGATILEPPVVVANPRAAGVDLGTPYSALVALAARLARQAVSDQNTRSTAAPSHKGKAISL